MKFEKDSLRFTVAYGGGCGSTVMKLVTDGNEHLDSSGDKFVFVKFYFEDEDPCEALFQRHLSFSLKEIQERGLKFIKFYSQDQPIRIE